MSEKSKLVVDEVIESIVAIPVFKALAKFDGSLISIIARFIREVAEKESISTVLEEIENVHETNELVLGLKRRREKVERGEDLREEVKSKVEDLFKL